MKFKYLILSLLTVFTFGSCTKSPEIIYQEGQGGAVFSVSSILTDTKADAHDANINIDDFKIELINSSGVIFKRWKTLSEYNALEDKTVLLNAGVPYTVRATYGDSTATGFDAFYFKGETTFTVEPQTSIEVGVVCKQANVEVAVAYGANMAAEYKDYHATIKHLRTRDSLVYEKNSTESGYFRPGDLKLYLYVTDLDGVHHRYGTKVPYYGMAGDSVTFTVDTKLTPTMELGFNITINSSTNDVEINVPIDAYMLSKDAPKFVTEGFDINTGVLSFVEGVEQSSAAVNINAASGIKSAVMTVNSPYLQAIGWPSQIDFLNIPSDVKSILSRDGLIWTSDMTGLTLANIDFKNVASILKYSASESADNTFTIKVTDNSSSSKTVSATFVLSVLKAEISTEEIANVDVWSQSFPLILSTNGNPTKLYPQIKAAGGSWITPAYTSSVSGSQNTITVSGLNPGTQYVVRGAYNDQRGEEKNITTEVALQMGNAGFENFYRTITDYSFKWLLITYTNQKVLFYPYSEGETDIWWSTNNSATTANATTPAYPYAKCFPTVNYTETAVHGGSKAAQVRSVSVHSQNDAVTTWGGKTQGKLFCDNHSFASRPTKVEFYYKYDSYNNDTFQASIELKSEGVVIATGSFTNSPSVSEWTLASVDLSYSDLKKKATSITVTFLSSTKSEPDVKIQTLTILGAEYTKTHTGSCITLDDIKLVYNK